MSKCIVLDAGHGRYGNPYPTIDGKYEGTQNFIYAGKLASRLEAAGFTVLPQVEGLEHRVDQSILRDVLVAKKAK